MMRKVIMEEISDLNKLGETDSLLILYNKNERGLKYKYLREDYMIRLFDGNIYVFDNEMELKSIFPIEYVRQFIRVSMNG